MPHKVSAGLLMYRKTPQGIEVFLIHPGGPFFQNKDLGTWSIPKGEIENPEDILSEAIREFHEETGTHPSTGQYIPLDTIRQKSGKVVHAWAFEGELTNPFHSNTLSMEWPPRSGKQIVIPEADRGEFFDAESAKQKINPAQAEFIDRLLQHLGM